MPATTDTELATDFSLDAVVERLSALNIPAYVEQTGGGCATIYAGTPYRDPEDPEWGDDRYPAVAGPGWFNGPGWTDGQGSVFEFCVGPDDDGTAEPDYMSEDEADPVGWTVQRISALVRA